jgi:hypothetical protein
LCDAQAIFRPDSCVAVLEWHDVLGRSLISARLFLKARSDLDAVTQVSEHPLLAAFRAIVT